MRQIENGTTPTINVLMVDATDLYTAETGATVTVNISKNGGAFAATSGSVTEISNGWYKVALTGTETDTDGELIIRATATGCAEWRSVAQVYTDVAASLTSEQYDAIADHVIRRWFSNVEDSSDGDTITAGENCLLTVGQKVSGPGSLSTEDDEFTIYQTDGTTILGVLPLTPAAGSTTPYTAQGVMTAT